MHKPRMKEQTKVEEGAMHDNMKPDGKEDNEQKYPLFWGKQGFFLNIKDTPQHEKTGRVWDQLRWS